MKQNKRTTILKLALLAVCIAVLATALVACNAKNKNNGNNSFGDGSGWASKEYFSEEALESYIGYCIEHQGHIEAGIWPKLYVSGEMITVGVCGADGYAIGGVYVLQSESDATILYNEFSRSHPEEVYTQNKNIVIREKEKDIFQNEILKSKIPESYHGSELHMNMIKEAFNSTTSCNDAVSYETLFQYSYNEEGEDFIGQDNRSGYSQGKYWCFSNKKRPHYSRREELEGLLPKLKTDYTDDSFINLNEEGGYYSAKLIDRPDTYRYENYSYKDGATKIDGIKITNYICTKDSLKSLIVPTKIDNKPVLSVELSSLNSTTVELPEGILDVYISNCINLETIILPKSLKNISRLDQYGAYRGFIRGCYSLKTIKYAGKKAEWEALVKNNDPNDWYVEEEYDYENQETTYKYITFKVECSDETITYSHK